jgi:hypothetical protein
MASPTAYQGWAVVELFGHVRLAGLVSEADQYGVKMLRIDVPEVDGRPAFTTYKGGSALFSVTPTTEEVAIAVVKQERPAPPIPYALQLRAMAPAISVADADEVPPEPDDDIDDEEADENGDPTF